MKPHFKDLRITVDRTDSFKQYLHDISKLPILTEEEEFELAVRAREGDDFSLRLLVECNLRFVVSVAKQHVDRYNKLEDLVNEGNMGLIKAAQKFDPSRGFKLISYAVWWIRQSINEYKNEYSRIIRLPGNKLSLVNKVRSSMDRLEQKLGRPASPYEIAEELGEDIILINQIIELEVSGYASLDKQLDDDGSSLLDLIPSDNCKSNDNVLLTSDKDFILKELLSTLKPRDEMILRLCFGFGEYKPLTLEEVGEIVGVSREAIRQIRDKSLVKLRKTIKDSTLDFSDIFKVE